MEVVQQSSGLPLTIVMEAGVYNVNTDFWAFSLGSNETWNGASEVVLLGKGSVEADESYSSATYINASRGSAHLFRINAGLRVQLADLTLTGGIIMGGTWLNVSAVRFLGTRGQGGLHVVDGKVTVSGSTFESITKRACLSGFEEGCQHGYEGGGMSVFGGHVTVRGCSFRGNRASNGGAVYVSGGELRMSRTRIIENVADVYGGGLYHIGGFVLLQSQTALRDNLAPAGGGSIHYDAGSLIYALPGPLGAWVSSAIECRPYRLPCPPGSTTCNPEEQPLLSNQPCNYEERPELLGRVVSYLTFGDIDDDFPYVTTRAHHVPACLNNLCRHPCILVWSHFGSILTSSVYRVLIGTRVRPAYSVTLWRRPSSRGRDARESAHRASL